MQCLPASDAAGMQSTARARAARADAAAAQHQLATARAPPPSGAEGALAGQERRTRLQEEAELEAADGLSAAGDAGLHATAEVGAAALCTAPPAFRFSPRGLPAAHAGLHGVYG